MFSDRGHVALLLLHFFLNSGLHDTMRGNARSARGSMQTDPKKNSSSLKNALWKLVLLQNVFGKIVQKFSDRFFFAKNDQCRHFIAIFVDEMTILSRYRWFSADITYNFYFIFISWALWGTIYRNWSPLWLSSTFCSWPVGNKPCQLIRPCPNNRWPFWLELATVAFHLHGWRRK